MMSPFDRDVHCLVGLPVDAVSMEQAATLVNGYISGQKRCFLTTPNLNFLITSLKDEEFRQSVILSDLVIADGMPLVWLSRLLAIPICKRVAGSDLFEHLRDQPRQPKVSVYFFGGPDGAAQEAAQHLDKNSAGMRSVGYQSPGFLPVSDISSPNNIHHINEANPDFLLVALGASKGQQWIMRNAADLNARVISHLGAVINFEAGSVCRAPSWMQKTGLEWIWRIMQEPSLWRRYQHDAVGLFKLLLKHAIPLAIINSMQRRRRTASAECPMRLVGNPTRLEIYRDISNPVPSRCRTILQEAARLDQDLTIDLNNCNFLDSGILGLLMILSARLNLNNHHLRLTGCSAKLRKVLRLNLVRFEIVD